jgi:hypothetical protein
MNFAIDLEFPHPPGDELGVLGAEIQDQNFFLMGIAHGFGVAEVMANCLKLPSV